MNRTGHLLLPGALGPDSGVRHPWGRLNFVSDLATTKVDGVTVGTATIEAGSENPLHIHGNCAEIILLLAGAVEHVVGEETLRLEAGDVLIVPAGTPHQARSVGTQAAEMVIVYNSGERDFRVVDD